MWMSSVPGAYDALAGVLSDALALEGVTVLDGPVVTDQALMEAVIVGYEDSETSAVVEASNAPEGLGRARDRETYSITCAVEVLLGSSVDMPTARRRAYALLGLVGAVLAQNPRLGGAVMMASLGTHTLSQMQGGQGALAQIVFGVEVDAFTRL